MKKTDMKYTVETYLPLFNGFYGSHWEDYFDNEIEWLIESEEYPKIKNYEDAFDMIDWEASYNKLAESIFWSVYNELSALEYVDTMEFQKVISPKYYNYTNDSINVSITITDKNIEKMQSVISEYFGDFESYVKEATTSRSGFSPYYNRSDFISDIDTVNPEAFKDEHHLGFILDFLLDVDGIEEYILDFEYVCAVFNENKTEVTQ